MHNSASIATNLFMYIDGVKSPLVVLQKRRGGHRFVVLGADDDDDQIPLLHESAQHPCYYRRPWFAAVCQRLTFSPR